MAGPPVAEVGEGAAGEASEREVREREELLALLKKDEEERLGGEEWTDNGFPSVTLYFFYLSFVFTLAPMLLAGDGSGATHP